MPLRSGYDAAIFRLAAPALGALAADPLVSLVDTAFVGRLGTEPLAALGVCSAIFGLVFFGFNFLAYGTTPLVAQALGRGERDHAARLVGNALVIAVGAGILASVVLIGAADPILRLMGAEGALRDEAGTYLRIRALAAPAVLLITAAHGAFRGHADTTTPLRITLGFNVVNLVLDPLLIFGAGWDLAGAAVATLVAQWVGALAFLAMMLGGRRAIPLTLGRPRAAEVGVFLRAGRDVIVRTMALLAAFTFATRVATRVGESAVAAHQIAIQVLILVALTIDSLAISAQAMVGRMVGQSQPAEARAVANRLLQLGFVGGALVSVLLLALADLLPPLFTDEAAVRAALDDIYPLLVLVQPLAALVYVWDGILLGAAAFRYVAVAMVASSAVTLVFLAFVEPLGWGLPGVWWGLVLLMAARLGTLGAWHLRAVGPLRA